MMLIIGDHCSRSSDGVGLGNSISIWSCYNSILAGVRLQSNKQTSMGSAFVSFHLLSSWRMWVLSWTRPSVYFVSYLNFTIALTIDQFFGTVIMVMTGLQAGAGWYHHRRFQKCVQPQPNGVARIHIWLGRGVIGAGMINCGFGLTLAQVKIKWAIVWWGTCGGLVVLYIGAFFLAQRYWGLTDDEADRG
jgi:hypothetical protein